MRVVLKTSCFIYYIKHTCNFISRYGVKKLYELIDEIKEVEVPYNAKSFDVQNLFHSILSFETLDLASKLLDRNSVNIIIKYSIAETLKIPLGQIYF